MTLTQRLTGPDTREGVREAPTRMSASTPNGIRTRVTSLKGRRPRPLDDGGLTRDRDRVTVAAPLDRS